MVRVVLKEMKNSSLDAVVLEAWLLRNDEYELQKHLQKAVHIRSDNAELWMFWLVGVHGNADKKEEGNDEK